MEGELLRALPMHGVAGAPPSTCAQGPRYGEGEMQQLELNRRPHRLVCFVEYAYAANRNIHLAAPNNTKCFPKE
jgi:hypothetical protein